MARGAGIRVVAAAELHGTDDPTGVEDGIGNGIRLVAEEGKRAGLPGLDQAAVIDEGRKADRRVVIVDRGVDASLRQAPRERHA